MRLWDCGGDGVVEEEEVGRRVLRGYGDVESGWAVDTGRETRRAREPR